VDPEVAWRLELLRSVGEECQTVPELQNLITKKPNFVLYDGFEPSGRMHIAQGIYKMLNVNKCTKAGGTFIFWVADWFALMNDKMGGDIEKIRVVGKYLIEVWKASGMDMSQVKFLWSSQEITQNAEVYWMQALDIARRSTLARVKKCCQIMGRGEDSLTAAQILYPIMQCADIFFLKADICQLGVDQRKVNMLARDYCDAARRKLKPVILSHHMLYGLKKGQAKMSKSDPDSAIFMEDSAEDVERKILNAYCPSVPEGDANTADQEMSLVADDLKNPCLDYIRYVLFSRENYEFCVGDQVFTEFEALREAFVAGDVAEAELKTSLIREINLLLEPVRQHFAGSPEAQELLEKVSTWRKENLTPATSETRLHLQGLDGRPVFAVMAPLAGEFVRFEDVWSVMVRLRSAPEGSQVVLWLEDWTASALDCLGGDKDAIKAFYDLLLQGLRTLSPGLMETVTVCWQGEAILAGSEEYWTSVIDAGRCCSLEDVRGAVPDGRLETASQVVAAIMHIGDVLALGSAGESILCGDPAREGLHRLATEQLSRRKLAAPELQLLAAPALRLRGDGEGLDEDTNVFLTDTQPVVNGKIKKAFCEPGNLDLNPPLEWVDLLMQLQGEFVVRRKPANGGDQSYTSSSTIREDFASGVLHPGDLKPALSKALNEALEPVRTDFKAAELKKAAKKLDTVRKALLKKAKQAKKG